MSHLEKVPSKQRPPQNAYSLKLKSIRRSILYDIYSTKELILEFFFCLTFRLIVL